MVLSAERTTSDDPQTASPTAITAWAASLRAIIQSIPKEYRTAVFVHVRDLIPTTPKPPQKGGELLNNVYELFSREPAMKRDAAEVVAALAAEGKPALQEPVRYALNYLNNRKILRRIGYGRYQLADGSIVEGSV